MPRRRAPKFSRLKSSEWDRYVEIKKGERQYRVERAAPAEDKERYACGVVPFGFSRPVPETNTMQPQSAEQGQSLSLRCRGFLMQLLELKRLLMQPTQLKMDFTRRWSRLQS